MLQKAGRTAVASPLFPDDPGQPRGVGPQFTHSAPNPNPKKLAPQATAGRLSLACDLSGPIPHMICPLWKKQQGTLEGTTGFHKGGAER